MTKTIAIGFLSVVAAMAQGPGPGPGGGRGFGGPGFGPGGGFGGFGPQKVVTGEPYSATETSTSVRTLANGQQITNSAQSTVARDGQGRVSTSRTVTPGAKSGKAPYTVITIFDPVAGFSYRLNSSTMTAIQIPLPPKRTGTRPARPEPPANPNVVTTNLGTQAINGVSANGTEVTRTIPAGTMGNQQPITSTRVTWVATTLQVPVEIKSNDPMFGTTDMELTNIVPAEPNAALFVVPAGYTVETAGAGRKGGRMRGGPGGKF